MDSVLLDFRFSSILKSLVVSFSFYKNLFQKLYRCDHNTRPKINIVPSAKHFACKATIIIQIVSRFDEM